MKRNFFWVKLGAATAVLSFVELSELEKETLFYEALIQKISKFIHLRTE